MTRLVIWRHGRTEWNHAGRVQGQTDVGLDTEGVAQAAQAAARVAAAYRPDLICASDLRRATQTAHALSVLTGLPVALDPRLRERHYGPWQGLTWAEIRERYPDDFARWGTATPVVDPAIEPLDDMAKRVSSALREVAERVGDGTAVVVTHGGAARAGSASLLGWPAAIWPTLTVLQNCGVSELRYSPERGWQLYAHNLP
jgi:glucosyl-3-phosphoglycerate phosphatase